MKIKQIVFAFGLAISSVAQSATYYVDPATGLDTNVGTQAMPWKSIPGSRNVANTAGLPTHTLLPGDIVEVKRGSNFGVASGVGRLEFTQSGTAAAPITIRCSTTWGTGICTFLGTGVTVGGFFGLITISTASYVSVKGFSIVLRNTAF